MPGVAAAEWHLTPFLGLIFQGDTSINDPEHGAEVTHWNFGGAVTFIGDGPIGAEGLIVYAPGFFEQDDSTLVTNSRSLAIMGNVVLATPRKWNEYGLRPFVSGGVGLLHASFDYLLAEVLPTVRPNLLGYNVGGGAVGFLSDQVGVRFDLRYFGTVNPKEAGPEEEPIAFGPERLSYWNASVGVVFKF
jgi:hypothetical protein